MGKSVTIGSPPIDITLRRSARARRYSLRISNADGLVSLTMPSRASEHAAVDFARRQEDWLRNALAKRPASIEPAFGATIPFRGRPTLLCQGTARAARLEADRLYLSGPPDRVAARLKGFLRVHARTALAEASMRYAAKLGREVGQISLRDTSSRWGSCTESGNLMYSWRLIMAPPAVLEYVAAHEVAHLVEMNHSADFWQVVAGLMPEYAKYRNWLRQNGASLHQVRL